MVEIPTYAFSLLNEGYTLGCHCLHRNEVNEGFNEKPINDIIATFSASCLACVVGFAVHALLSNKMEPDLRSFATIIAKDPNLFKDHISVSSWKSASFEFRRQYLHLIAEGKWKCNQCWHQLIKDCVCCMMSMMTYNILQITLNSPEGLSFLYWPLILIRPFRIIKGCCPRVSSSSKS